MRNDEAARDRAGNEHFVVWRIEQLRRVALHDLDRRQRLARNIRRCDALKQGALFRREDDKFRVHWLSPFSCGA
jgi:hypothetical protein